MTSQSENEASSGSSHGVSESNLPPWVVRILHLSETAEHTSDHLYFEVILAEETMRRMTYTLTDNLGTRTFSHTLESAFPEPRDDVSRRGRTLQDKLRKIGLVLAEKRTKMLALGKRQPLIERFLDNMKATHVQRLIFRHMIARASGLAQPGRNDRWASASDAESFRNDIFLMQQSHQSTALYVDLARTDLLELFPGVVTLEDIRPMLEPESIWVKEQIYSPEQMPGMFMSQLDMLALRVLLGGTLTVAQYHALPSGVLQTSLLEDESFCGTETGKAVLRQRQQLERPAEQVRSSQPSTLAQALMDHSTGRRGIKRDRLFEVLASATKKFPKLKEANQGQNQWAEGVPPLDPVQQVPAEETTAGKIDDPVSQSGDTSDKQEEEYGPYASDLAYLQDQIRIVDMEATLIQAKVAVEASSRGDSNFAGSGDDPYYFSEMLGVDHRNAEGAIKVRREAEKHARKLKQLQHRVQARLLAPWKGKSREFRLEQLCEALELQKFEKYCILELVKSLITMRGSRAQVGQLIQRFCSTLEEKMTSRRFFYKSSTLVREGILTVHQTDFMTDLSMCSVELDRRLFDYVVGLDTEMSEIVDGSHLYLPDVDLEDVVLAPETKKRVCDSVLNYEKVRSKVHELEIDRKITYGLGQVLLFYGASGTGKTMLANAIAKKLGKKVLLVNFPSLGSNTAGPLIKFLFREARINRALLFFDECETLFLSRDKGGRSVNMILTELERFEGLCILATNRAHDLDEAMHRRVSLAIEFRKPDHILREKIWKTLQPPKLPLEDGINFGHIAKKYELSGGLIKNAWLQSVSLMVRRDGEKVNEEDLVQAASEQVVGQLSMESFDRRVVPTCGIDSVILTPVIKQSLNSIVQYTKAQSVLFGQWGFEKLHRSTTGISAMFTGPPGTGKTMAAEAVGFDLGRPLLVVNVAELVSKWVGETGKNISALFSDAKKKDAVLVFDEAEGLFGSRESSGGATTSRHDTMNVGLLLQYVEDFPGVCIVITNMKSSIDDAFFRRFRFVLNFEMPDALSRERIWKMMVPEECPVAPDVSYRDLASRYEICGGDIKNALLRASTIAALRADELRVVTMADLREACEAEISKRDGKIRTRDMYI